MKSSIIHGQPVHWNLTPSELIERAVTRGEGHLLSNGAFSVDTGTFKGRSPKDKFIVSDSITAETVWWNDFNNRLDPAAFDRVYKRLLAYLSNKELFARDAYVCALSEYRVNLRVYTETASQNLFAYNMFLRPTPEECARCEPDWTIIAAPNFSADPKIDGTRQSNFTIVNFSQKLLLIGGSRFSGEIKKGIFSILNFTLPCDHNVLPMHCGANVGRAGDAALFFGLSGTGKTTLSSDPQRFLVGDDEHGWTTDKVFNFEGGCYAKVVNLDQEKEPQIFEAIKFGALLENVTCHKNTRQANYADTSMTQNTRGSYPLHYVNKALTQSIADSPRNIFFLAADTFGVLPPISRLTKSQALYYFLSGYSAITPGSEAGSQREPTPTFSACFALPFLTLSPTRYAQMFDTKINFQNVNIWLVNTGWVGGSFGVGHRMELNHTRILIRAALDDKLCTANTKDKHFRLSIPLECPGVPQHLLDPASAWNCTEDYDSKARELSALFHKNFKNYAVTKEVKDAGPSPACAITFQSTSAAVTK